MIGLYNFEDDINESLKALEQGKTILYPTDTVWGVGCDATNQGAVEEIFCLKNRSEEKSMIVLVDSFQMLKKHVLNITEEWFKVLEEFKTPTTVIYPNAVGLAKNAIALNGSIAIRVCNDSFCKKLIFAFGNPIVSTSANVSGKKPPTNFNEINSQIKADVGYVVQYRQMEGATFKPSTIIKWTANNLFETIRE